MNLATFKFHWVFVRRYQGTNMKKFIHKKLKNQVTYIKWKLPLYARFQVLTLISLHQYPLNFESCPIHQKQLLYFILNPTFILVVSTTAKLCRVLVGKMAKK
jgi:hypothetical protein